METDGQHTAHQDYIHFFRVRCISDTIRSTRVSHDIVDCTSSGVSACQWVESTTQCACVLILFRRPPPSAYHLPSLTSLILVTSGPFDAHGLLSKEASLKVLDGSPLLAWSALVDCYHAGQSALRIASTMHGCDAPLLQPLFLASSSGALCLPPTTPHCLCP
jgi:hypothetical protein